MLNPIFWKKVQGQKHPGRWEIAERQIPSIKMLSRTDTKVRRHHGIRLFIIQQDTISKPKKTIVAFNPGTAHFPEIQSYRMWWGAASPILNDTPAACIYTYYNRTHINNAYVHIHYIICICYIYIYIYILTQSFWTGTKVIKRKHIMQSTGFGACSSTCCQWDGEDVSAPWERSNSHPPALVQNSWVNQFIQYNICSRGDLLSRISNSVIVISLQSNVFLQQLIVAV